MTRKTKKKGFLYGTWISSSGMRLEGEMPASKFIGIIHAGSNEQEREAIRKELSSNDKQLAKEKS